MAIYKVVVSEEVKTKYTAYVEAENQECADHWASMVECFESVGVVTDEIDMGGEVEYVELENSVPPGFKLNKAHSL